MKGTTRAKYGKGVRRRVAAAACIPGNWQDFLCVDSNKTILYKFLSYVLLDLFNQEVKQLVITDGEAVLTKPPIHELGSLSHEEADSHMLLHVCHAAQCGHHTLLNRTVNTDVVVLAVSVPHSLGSECELWLAFGTGKYFYYLSTHKISNVFGPEKSRALPMFHALTGCDTVSNFVGKKTAWNTWNLLPELTDVLLQLSSAPRDIPEDVIPIIERSVILL